MRDVLILRKQNQAELVVFPATILMPGAVHITATLFLVLKLKKTVYLLRTVINSGTLSLKCFAINT